eukprot:scaffold1959_cov243-Pinguiococcus_pyrenoidosus.AAC.15
MSPVQVHERLLIHPSLDVRAETHLARKVRVCGLRGHSVAAKLSQQRVELVECQMAVGVGVKAPEDTSSHVLAQRAQVAFTNVPQASL